MNHASRPVAALALLNELANGQSSETSRTKPELTSKQRSGQLLQTAILCRARRDYDTAARHLLEATELDPLNAELFFLLGTTLHQCGKPQLALRAMRQASELAPENASVLTNLGRILLDLERDEEAEAILRSGLEQAPNDPVILRMLATLLRDKGDGPGARCLWLHLLTQQPADAEARYNLAHGPDFHPDATWIAETERLAKKTSDATDCAMLLFALFRAHERSDNPDLAFAALERGNQVCRLSFRHDPQIEEALFAALQSHFDAAYFQAPPRDDRQSPIFIVGMPRSGTSLAEQILASHPCVHGGGERAELTELVVEYLADPRHPRLMLDGFEPHAPKASIMADRYLTALRQVAGGKPRFTDKMPLNFRWIGIIKTLFPNARIIHCTRPPIENCMSIYASLFGSEGNRYAYEQQELGRYYAAHVQLMQHWTNVLGEDHILHFDLTALKQDQEGQTRRLLEFCSLEWSDTCLSFERTNRAVKTLSAARVREGLDRSKDRRTEMFRPFLAPLEATLRDARIDPDHHWN